MGVRVEIDHKGGIWLRQAKIYVWIGPDQVCCIPHDWSGNGQKRCWPRSSVRQAGYDTSSDSFGRPKAEAWLEMQDGSHISLANRIAPDTARMLAERMNTILSAPSPKQKAQEFIQADHKAENLLHHPELARTVHRHDEPGKIVLTMEPLKSLFGNTEQRLLIIDDKLRFEERKQATDYKDSRQWPRKAIADAYAHLHPPSRDQSRSYDLRIELQSELGNSRSDSILRGRTVGELDQLSKILHEVLGLPTREERGRQWLVDHRTPVVETKAIETKNPTDVEYATVILDEAKAEYWEGGMTLRLAAIPFRTLLKDNSGLKAAFLLLIGAMATFSPLLLKVGFDIVFGIPFAIVGLIATAFVLGQLGATVRIVTIVCDWNLRMLTIEEEFSWPWPRTRWREWPLDQIREIWCSRQIVQLVVEDGKIQTFLTSASNHQFETVAHHLSPAAGFVGRPLNQP